MKNNKTIIAVCAAILSAVTLTACGSTQAPAAETTVTTTTTAETTTTEVTTTTVHETTTTTETTTTAAPETTTETTEQTGIVTMADNDEGMYTIAECFRRKAEEESGKKVVRFDFYVKDIPRIAVLEDDTTVGFGYSGFTDFDSNTIVSIDRFEISYDDLQENIAFGVIFQNT